MNNIEYPLIRIGLCCQNITLRYSKPSIFASGSVKLKTIKDKGLIAAKQKALENLENLKKMMKWNYEHGILVFRMGSDLFPHASNATLIELFGKEGKDYMKLKFAKPQLKEIGQLATKYGMRLTMHPGQYLQLASPHERVQKSSLLELKYHARILNNMGLPPDSIMVVHGGGTFGVKDKTLEVMEKGIMNLPEKIKKRLVLENDEKCYGVDDLLPICQRTKVPFVFDYFHHECYKKLHPDEKIKDIRQLLPDIIKTWTIRGMRPKVHLSEQGPGRTGAHAVFIEKIPDLLFKMGPVDIMLEAKGKEMAISRVYHKYPKLRPKGSKDLPTVIPKRAMKDIRIEEKYVDVSCHCDKFGCQVGGVCYYRKYMKYKKKYLDLIRSE
jgi:UV DNA damage endonuclease